MRNFLLLALFTAFITACVQVEPLPPRRTMGMKSLPSQVFTMPVQEIIPSLANATPTNKNGRVGNELVFWEYVFTNKKTSYFFACGIFEGVDCQDRLQYICKAGKPKISESKTLEGRVRQINCRDIGVIGTGDSLPNCTQDQEQGDIFVGLANCS